MLSVFLLFSFWMIVAKYSIERNQAQHIKTITANYLQPNAIHLVTNPQIPNPGPVLRYPIMSPLESRQKIQLPCSVLYLSVIEKTWFQSSRGCHIGQGYSD